MREAVHGSVPAWGETQILLTESLATCKTVQLTISQDSNVLIAENECAYCALVYTMFTLEFMADLHALCLSVYYYWVFKSTRLTAMF